ncbi:MAG: ferric reductase-like transmembrane domain-containing protein [candidate division KSB1 bacterium]|nr:ferric reductase-like transmembrane domain-containing protein [candidate division KSB1 bacterium]MDZ7273903.1 ferric reductase-like transmembrane domain-containing protein [candidate division KSB1 bacterium]MDZ7286059.1 ferric reductase-like transmembrane domain-containing protein [candidate division KSB1 bacterium]MDZ7299091.1 ferric reductase-like transmembrane domain-containing protein [candidate division KSB1 bacterium]MDZ7306394.1 ferric reductase-like transmembrane domain-containing pr
MSLAYRAVSWNRQKRLYDIVLLVGLVLYLAVFIAAGLRWHPQATIETLIIRALGTAALLLLHLILAIGPLCRLQPRFLPLLYNRRHLGVTMFLLALGHAVLSLRHFHGAGNLNPLVSLLVSNTRYASLSGFPFEILGLLALLIFFILAATSHDFWLAQLTAPVWKSLHMLIYPAYGVIVMHVTLGALQAETNPLLAVVMAAGMTVVLSLHVAAGRRERKRDRETRRADAGGFVEVCGAGEIPEKRALIFTISGERVAVFRYDGRISAVSNVCPHQNGPLGEGRIVEGCLTCPWHGHRYFPDTGAAAPPFSGKVPTFVVRVRQGRVFIQTTPLAPGTRVAPALIN